MKRTAFILFALAFGGYFYASYPYMALKTMDIMVHKNAIPKAIRKKLGIN